MEEEPIRCHYQNCPSNRTYGSTWALRSHILTTHLKQPSHVISASPPIMESFKRVSSEEETSAEPMEFIMKGEESSDSDNKSHYCEEPFRKDYWFEAVALDSNPKNPDVSNLELMVAEFALDCGLSQECIIRKLSEGQSKKVTLEISPPGSVILGLMLASDKTVITGNNRDSAWPIYLKLANTPLKYRTYFPVVESKMLAKKPWFSVAKKAIFHYCLDKILAPFKKYTAYKMKGPENKMYMCVPTLAAYTADLQEYLSVTHGQRKKEKKKYLKAIRFIKCSPVFQ
ncbi:hypothetical protein BJV82DRAFT_584447 [Fennellomyces sp. T-0311]|nr:hypothetical protein BJV82DRAFT_584447 [Fennellomyces sp. T-0311]